MTIVCVVWRLPALGLDIVNMGMFTGTDIRDDLAELSRQEAIIQVQDYAGLKTTLADLLEHEEARARLEQNARRVNETRADVLGAYLEQIADYLR